MKRQNTSIGIAILNFIECFSVPLFVCLFVCLVGCLLFRPKYSKISGELPFDSLMTNKECLALASKGGGYKTTFFGIFEEKQIESTYTTSKLAAYQLSRSQDISLV